MLSNTPINSQLISYPELKEPRLRRIDSFTISDNIGSKHPMTVFSNFSFSHVSTPPSSLWPMGKAIDKTLLAESKNPKHESIPGVIIRWPTKTLPRKKEMFLWLTLKLLLQK